MIHGLYAKHTGTPLDKIEEAMERDNFMNPTEAMKFGLIDRIEDSRD